MSTVKGPLIRLILTVAYGPGHNPSFWRTAQLSKAQNSAFIHEPEDERVDQNTHQKSKDLEP